VDGKATEEIPARGTGYEKIECIYKTLPGWRTSTVGSCCNGGLAHL
jgi:adenylosuccinate synthase